MMRSAKSENSTIVSTLNSAWAGVPLGNKTRQHGDRRTNGPYHVFITAGIQPDQAQDLLAQDSNGFLQRFLFTAVTDPYRHVNEPVIPSPTIPPAGTMPHIRSGDKFTADQKVIDELSADDLDYDLDHLHDEYAEKMSHALQVRLRVTMLAALLHGTLHVTYELWEWAGLLMEHSHRVFAWLEVQAAEKSKEAAHKEGQMRAEAKAAQNSAETNMVHETATAICRVLTKKSVPQNGYTAAKITSYLARSKKEWVWLALSYLSTGGKIVEVDGKYRVFDASSSNAGGSAG
jgi:hypothetical protein